MNVYRGYGGKAPLFNVKMIHPFMEIKIPSSWTQKWIQYPNQFQFNPIHISKPVSLRYVYCICISLTSARFLWRCFFLEDPSQNCLSSFVSLTPSLRLQWIALQILGYEYTLESSSLRNSRHFCAFVFLLTTARPWTTQLSRRSCFRWQYSSDRIGVYGTLCA